MSDRADQIGMEASDWLVRLREAPDDWELAQDFAAWHDASLDHARAWDEMQAIFDLIGEIKPRHPQHLVRNEGGSVPAIVRSRTHGRRLIGRFGVMGLAAACVGVLIGPDLLLRMRADHLTSAGQMETVALEDGSRIRLGPESAIAIDYGLRHRNIRLFKGQAWFEVAPDEMRPFQVRADDITATALGTAFDVRMIGDERSVAVGHGRVRVEDPAKDAALIQPLGHGDWISLVPMQRPTRGHQASDLAGLWQTGSVVIRGRTVAEAIDELRPWYRGRIFLANRAIGEKRITGIFSLDDPQDALLALVQPHGGTITQLTPWIMIVR